MDDNQGFRLRGYADLCREFIDRASPLVTEVYCRNDDHDSNPVMIHNLRFAFNACGYCAKDGTLAVILLLTPFAFPKALVAAAQDRAAIKFADNLARRLIGPGAYSAPHIIRMMPPAIKSGEGLEYARKRKLRSLESLIGYALK